MSLIIHLNNFGFKKIAELIRTNNSLDLILNEMSNDDIIMLAKIFISFGDFAFEHTLYKIYENRLLDNSFNWVNDKYKILYFNRLSKKQQSEEIFGIPLRDIVDDFYDQLQQFTKPI